METNLPNFDEYILNFFAFATQQELEERKQEIRNSRKFDFTAILFILAVCLIILIAVNFTRK